VGLSRAAQLAWRLTLGGASLAACTSTTSPPLAPSASSPDAASSSPTPSPPPDLGSTDASAPDAEVPDAGPPRRVIAIYGSNVIVILQRITFARGKDALEKKHDQTLDAVAETMRSRSITVALEGHAEATEGVPAGPLSEARARKVMQALVARGVAKDRLRVRGLGSTQPTESGSSESNRGVSFKIEMMDGAPVDAGVPVDAGAP